ncbi:exodeoxyribonuclease V subunit alpha [Paraflavisolibacter sp. H34]|uniref:exodeoxyribonuclease V subunit alpha n=1 Tax=Huijunlia imazamoxiresistens TaxID=3127457 RepID=UPI00301A4B3C
MSQLPLLFDAPRPAASPFPLPQPAVNDVHLQFALFFKSDLLRPYAYLLSQKLAEGHVCIDLDRLLPGEDFPFKSRDLSQWSALRSDPLVSDGTQRRPFVLHGNRLYLHRYFAYETSVLDRLKTFLQNGRDAYAHRVRQLDGLNDFIKSVFAPPPGAAPVADWQLAAALSGVLNNFTIITGGPGTGKTTTVARILALLFALDPQLKVALAAPTGKAAARMAESLKKATLPVDAAIKEKFAALEPATLHRLLKNIPDTLRFRHHRDNPLPFDVVIIDESSMIDLSLFARLLDAIGPHTRLLLLGDKDQLAAVEAGSLFGDLCGAGERLNTFPADRVALFNSFIADPARRLPPEAAAEENAHPLFGYIVELRHSHRFSGEAGIGRFSKAVIGARAADLQAFLPPATDQQVEIDPDYSPKIFESFAAGYAAFIREKDTLSALKLLGELRVLCALREGEQGLHALNKKIERYLQKKGLLSLSGEFYEHRPVMVTRNYYNLNLFNGDIGLLRYDARGQLRAWFEDGEGGVRSVAPGYLSQCETVFAMTIHKSQGSEFNRVLVVLPQSADIPILTRELLYTGVTRARTSVLIQGSGDGILSCAGRCVERGSGVRARVYEFTGSRVYEFPAGASNS